MTGTGRSLGHSSDYTEQTDGGRAFHTRLVPKSVTLNDLEQHNGQCLALFYRIQQLWLKIDLKCLEQKCSLKKFLAIWVYD